MWLEGESEGFKGAAEIVSMLFHIIHHIYFDSFPPNTGLNAFLSW